MQVVRMLQTKNLILSKRLKMMADILSEILVWYKKHEQPLPQKVFLEIYEKHKKGI